MRVIKGITHSTYNMLCEDLPSRFAATVLQTEGDLLDIELNKNVIVKAYDDSLILDLGGKKARLDLDEFVLFNFI